VLAAVLLVGAIEGGALMLIGMLHSQPNRELLIAPSEGVFGENWIGAVIP
jgi:hypothetical protein